MAKARRGERGRVGYSFYGLLARRSPAHAERGNITKHSARHHQFETARQARGKINPEKNEEQQARRRDACTGEDLILTWGGGRGRDEREEARTIDYLCPGECVALEEVGLSLRVKDDIIRGDPSGQFRRYKEQFNLARADLPVRELCAHHPRKLRDVHDLAILLEFER